MKRLLAILACSTLCSYVCAANILLNDAMTREEQKKTGVYYLNARQKQALEAWLNENFDRKSDKEKASVLPEGKHLYLSQNIDNGRILRLDDDSEYLVAPEDVEQSSFWITPFPLRIEESDDPEYPQRIVNINNGKSVKVKQTKPGRYK